MRKRPRGFGLTVAAILAGCLSFGVARAEPYFAVREGLKCASCHVSASGGGLRNAFGNGWALAMLAQSRSESIAAEAWTGTITRHVAVGGNLRAGYTYTDVPHAQAQSQFDLEEARAYLAIDVIPERILLYVDQRIAPGGSANMEAYARYSSADRRWQVRAGQLYLPFGWRLEDDSAFVRQVTGINFNTPDKGVEIGLETAMWSMQLALTNGAAAGPETNRGKQVSFRAEHVRSAWRLGAGFNHNDAQDADRQMQGIFAGLRTGPVAWLAEADYVLDDSFVEGRRKQWVGLLEANWNVLAGHNLKLSAECFEPDADVDEDEQNRFSLVWEYSPWPFLQLRTGARVYDGIPQNDLQNRKLLFVAVNGYF